MTGPVGHPEVHPDRVPGHRFAARLQRGHNLLHSSGSGPRSRPPPGNAPDREPYGCPRRRRRAATSPRPGAPGRRWPGTGHSAARPARSAPAAVNGTLLIICTVDQRPPSPCRRHSCKKPSAASSRFARVNVNFPVPARFAVSDGTSSASSAIDSAQVSKPDSVRRQTGVTNDLRGSLRFRHEAT